jgi:pimeloyl-ACP methyl ester carboxylesterase
MADGIPGAKLTITADGGHLAQVERPQPTSDALVEWLQY